jgi:peptidyl-prolyl cis-trans isomerase SurA
MRRALVLAVGVWGAALSAHAELVDRVAAVVNNDIIPLSEVQKRAAPELARLPPQPDAEARAKARDQVLKNALDQIIADRLLDADSKELNITVTEQEVQLGIADVRQQNNLSEAQFEQELRAAGYTPQSYVDFMRKQLVRLKLLQQRIRSKIKLSEADLRAEYGRYAKREGTEVEIHARHLVVQLPQNASPAQVEQALKKALALMKEARNPGVDFAKLAKQKSEGPSAPDGGDLGYFRRGTMMPEFEHTAFALEDGQVSEPVRTRFGWHVIKVEERRPIGVKTFEEMKPALQEKLYREQLERLTEQHVQSLRSAAVVEVKL